MKKLVLSGLVIMSSLGQASEKLEEEKKWHFNMSVYKDYTSNLDAKFSYDVHRSGDFSLALGLGGSAIDLKDVNAFAGLVSLGVRNSVSENAVIKLEADVGSQFYNDIVDPYLQTNFALVTTNRFFSMDSKNQNIEFGVGTKTFFLKADNDSYRTETSYIYPYVGLNF